MSQTPINDSLSTLYGSSLALLTDLYQLTMAYGYWKNHRSQQEAVFHLFFRHAPFRSGYAIACGLKTATEYVDRFQFTDRDLTYLSELTGSDGRPLFEPAFLDELSGMRLNCDLDAVPEGTVVFPHEPLLRVQGPILQAQILESALLNVINFQTLVATKAARVCLAAAGQRVVEFGLRRAQGIDGALAASRAAYLGGCAATSNLLAGQLYGIPVQGTHAHSWVMSFESELEAFHAYAKAMPNNCVFLVDTYDSISGVKHAIEVGKSLRAEGHELLGIRLDSGDLARLSIEARELLDAAGFSSARIVASNDLDEHLIASLRQQGAAINVWGVGTKLVTAYDQPALGGVYKLGAVRQPGEAWQYRLKVSEQMIKISTPGVLQVRRFARNGQVIGDMLYDEGLGAATANQSVVVVDPLDPNRERRLPAEATWRDLLVPIYRQGKLVANLPSLEESRRRAADELAQLPATIKRFDNPQEYSVGLEPRLHQLKTRLVRQHRGLE